MRVARIPAEETAGFSVSDPGTGECTVVSDGVSFYCFACRSDSCAHASAAAAYAGKIRSERIESMVSRLDPGADVLSGDADDICREIFSGPGGHDSKVRMFARLMDSCFRLESGGAMIWADPVWEEKAVSELRLSSAEAVWDAVSSEGGDWARDAAAGLDPGIMKELADAHPGEPALKDVYFALGRYGEYADVSENRAEAVLEAFRKLMSEGRTSEALRMADILPDIAGMDARSRNAAYEVFRISGNAEAMRRIEAENLVREPSEYALRKAMSAGKGREELVRAVAAERLGSDADDSALAFLARNGMSAEVFADLESRGFLLPDGQSIMKAIRAMDVSGQGVLARKAAGSFAEAALREGRPDLFPEAAAALSFLEAGCRRDPGGAREFRRFRSRLQEEYGGRKEFWDLAARNSR